MEQSSFAFSDYYLTGFSQIIVMPIEILDLKITEDQLQQP
jgi:hypothetical protein